MENRLFVSPSPHIHGAISTQKLMRDVLLALLPAFIFSVVVYGMGALIVTGVSVASCVVFEYLIQRYLLGGKSTVGDYSAILTGVLLGFNLPSTLPVWQVVIGAMAAIGIGKMSFGGLGRNPFNPALVGRVFLLISFPGTMASFAAPVGVDSYSGATPLALAKTVLRSGKSIGEIFPGGISYSDMMMGFKAGSLGEIAALALLAGFAWLLYRKVITWHIPVYVLGTIAVFTGLLWLIDSQHYMSPLFHLLSGGAILGAVYMATDYVTSPMNTRAMAVYGIGIGLITVLIRVWGAYPEGISFAILIMNAVVPLLNKYIKPRRFGVVKK